MSDMTFDVYVSGQYMENYSDDPSKYQSWKFKGSHRELAIRNVTLAELPQALKDAEVKFDELSWSDDGSRFYASAVEYFPHGANLSVMAMIEYGIESGKRYSCFVVEQEEIELAERFLRFMGQEENQLSET